MKQQLSEALAWDHELIWAIRNEAQFPKEADAGTELLRTILAAARFWLSLLEGDEALVEKVEWCEEHGQCKMACGLEDDDGMYPPSLDHRFVERLLVLAAITEGRT